MYLRFLFYAIPQVILMLFQFCFSFLIALSVTKEGHLRFFPVLFEPSDSLAIGNRMYWDNEMAYAMDWPVWIRNYWLALNWGMRNPAYGFADWAAVTMRGADNFKTTAKLGDKEIDVGDAGVVISSVFRTFTNGDGKKYFEYRKVWRSSIANVRYIQLGWSIPSAAAEFKDGIKCHLCLYFRPAFKIK